MAIKALSLKQSMNKNVQAIMPQEDEKAEFEKKLISYLETLQAKKTESEEYQKNLISDFLKALLQKNFINTSNRIDLAIYNGQGSTSSLGVIIEVKSLTNKSEMMTRENINAKALRETVAYYMGERFSGNLEIKKAIITNGLSWFIIEAKELEKYFYNNKKLHDLYDKWQKGQLSSSKTDFLYSEVIAPEIDRAIDKGIAIAHFNLIDALASKNPMRLKKNNLTQLYRFFSSENLLNKEIFTDSNKLNKAFYDELLYIMGLEETKEGTSKVIKRLKPEKREYASLVESVISRLNQNDVPTEKQYDNAIQLAVVWVNRILFLKLLESQLVAFNNNEKFKFLTYDKIKSYGDLSDLFFGILAKRHEQRDPRLEEKFGNIPYLNSSLFEETDLERSHDGIAIDRLREEDIQIYSKTVLKGAGGKRKSGKMDFHQYLFEFLNAYDFSTTVTRKENSQNELINASVLGLIFEKINGYADGSFFTPGKITMYMSRRALRSAVMDKVNQTLGWNAKTIEDLKFKIDNIEVARKVGQAIDNLKICDPAVGSGHFLVSILNEIVALKNELRCLFDADGKILNDIHCYVANDELIVQDFSGDNFAYHVGNIPSARIQKALFIQKQTIIENSLFGVDINPNSANICRLRLWIELLKNSYYDESGELVTLPNIDINIKVGDSLLHKFDFDFSFDLRKNDFKEYLQLVKEYKSTNNKRTKAEIFDKISKIKSSFDDTATSPELKRLKQLKKELGDAAKINLFGDSKDEQKRFEEVSKQFTAAQKEFGKAMQNPMFAKGLEWRMEFPEILDEDGNFVGFDLVIGNPPYIFTRGQSFTEEMKTFFLETYEVSQFKANTYTFFIELAYKLMRTGGTFSYIIPNNFLTLSTNSKVRNFITEKTGNIVIINSQDKIFADASVDNCIIFFKKNTPNWIEVSELKSGEFQTLGKVESNFFKNSPTFSLSLVKYKDAIQAFEKANSFPKLNRLGVATVKTGVQAYAKNEGTPKQSEEDKKNRVFHSNEKIDETYRKYLDGENVSRYALTWNGEWLKYGKHLARMRDPRIFDNPRILVRQIPTYSTHAIEAMFIDEEYINDVNSAIITEISMNPLYILGVINSKLITLWFMMNFDKFQRRVFPQFKVNELGEFPIPDASEDLQNKIAQPVQQLMDEMKKEIRDEALISSLNTQIDELVLDLFQLKDEEKQSVREFEV
ncbi:Type I restriction-modification system methyltransferase subunit [Lactococcus cremoris subsp. cremoris SK11]|uniref:site-specific DNA-methyltransferase (adenine-specific) n=2 Tax=Lactococcus lactis subsp. cremoris TaxID=1359 RepID=Q02YN3_LACLS|nr:TaqI-like C-terminal specificity domain-containing protein [Lactococcus cremoris]ABJ72939.1 Type I restriction-modification system methyltransferase subunit [Lactococcus cremoris subsp. cremoris SK11]ARE23542.1 TaqI-like C-terminal specificity domain-containing protein [Lactococcus cremoris]KZK45117.1 DNA modification methylase [Lactococcus cremoris]MCT4421486.1 type II restriction endonuclease [Lactococcus cremoris]MCT4424617.1 type II restriction endonuclease [Lactococcus cremoris]